MTKPDTLAAALFIALTIAGTAVASTLPSVAELVLDIPAPQDEPPVEIADAGEDEKSPWTSSIGLGLTASRTDSNTTGLNFNFTTSRKDELSTWASSVKYIYNSDDSQVQDNFLVAQTDYDQLIAPDDPTPWSWFANGSYQFNQTESYRQRGKGFGGAGYSFSRTAELRWSGRGGLGSTWDERGSERGWTTRAQFSTIADWKPTDGIKIEGSVGFEPALDDFRNYLVVLEMKINVALKSMDDLSIYMTIRDEYDSRPGSGDEYNQIWLTLGFAYGF